MNTVSCVSQSATITFTLRIYYCANKSRLIYKQRKTVTTSPVAATTATRCIIVTTSCSSAISTTILMIVVSISVPVTNSSRSNQPIETQQQQICKTSDHHWLTILRPRFTNKVQIAINLNRAPIGRHHGNVRHCHDFDHTHNV